VGAAKNLAAPYFTLNLTLKKLIQLFIE